jgi:short-subunit dehydrogenase
LAIKSDVMRQKIVITGASSGIGAALAQRLAAPDTMLLLWGRDAARLESVAQQCRAAGAQVDIDAFDLRGTDELMARLARADSDAPIDMVIFNAGLGGSVPRDQLAEAPANAKATAEVNFVAPVVGASVMSDAMARRGRGHIVLIGSISESFPLPMAPTYAATKAGLAMYAEALGIRMARHGVAVTLVSPGFIDTPMSQQLHEPRLFLMSAERAAQIIVRKLKSKPARIVLPWQFIIIRAAANLVPRSVMRLFLNRV